MASLKSLPGIVVLALMPFSVQAGTIQGQSLVQMDGGDNTPFIQQKERSDNHRNIEDVDGDLTEQNVFEEEKGDIELTPLGEQHSSSQDDKASTAHMPVGFLIWKIILFEHVWASTVTTTIVFERFHFLFVIFVRHCCLVVPSSSGQRVPIGKRRVPKVLSGQYLQTVNLLR